MHHLLDPASWKSLADWLAQRGQKAFRAAQILSEQDKHEEAEAAFAKLAKDGTASYRSLARLREAAELARHDPKAAVEMYDDIARNGALGPVIQDLAALRAGYVLVDTAPYDEMNRRIEPLTAADRAFHHSARALMALAAWRADDVKAAKRWFDMIMADRDTPESTRSQVEMLNALFAGEGKS